MTGDCKRIAMWSGPRNLSTAMMYSFAQRSDTCVIDEPFYAAYLAATGIRHTLYREIIAAGDTDADSVARYCCEQRPQPTPVFYQKHMTKHMIEGFDRQWIHRVCNVFLIRDPGRVIVSYHARQENPVLSDIGVKEQVELFDSVCQRTGVAPVVIDSADILAAPELMLRSLCAALDITFQPQMLHWQPGPKAYDGVWAPHWYQSVWRSTGFGGAQTSQVAVPDKLKNLLAEADAYYQQIRPYALPRPASD